MDRQINLFKHMNEKPPIGSIVCFVETDMVRKATVISHDASFAGVSFEGYIKVKTQDGQIWSVKKYYSSRKEAKDSI